MARKLRLPSGARQLLDIGGGHGLYSAALCRRHPGLTATVLDLPGSAAVGREIVAAAGMADRVRFRDGDATAGDLGSGDLGSGYDAVLCFNLVHHLSPDQIPALFGKAREALAPGGTLAVMDAFADPAAGPRRRRTSSACSSTSARARRCTPPRSCAAGSAKQASVPRAASACCASQGCPCTWSRSS